MDLIPFLVCIIAMISSVLPQNVYYQTEYQIPYTSNTYASPQAENLYYNQAITENLYQRSLGVPKHKERIQHYPRIENGSNHPQINKRGTLEKYGSELNDRVVFPGPTSNNRRAEEATVTDECRRRGFCTGNEVQDYPSDIVDRLINEGKVKIQLDGPDEDDIQIAQRLGGDTGEQETPLCGVNQTMIYPKSLPDRDGTYFNVVNRDDKPVQGFFVELCVMTSSGNESNCHDVVSFEEGYKGRCRQKYVYRMVDIIINDKLERRQLRLPGCCSCVVTKNVF